MLSFYYFLILCWVTAADVDDVRISDCLLTNDSPSDNFFYLSLTDLHLPCVNEWEVSGTANISQKLIVSSTLRDIPSIKLLHNQTNTQPNSWRYVHWLIRSSSNCMTDELYSAVPTASFTKINDHFFLMSFSPVQLSPETADLAVRFCRKQDISFRNSWIKSDDSHVTDRDVHMVRDDIKDAFVKYINEPEGEFINLLEQLSGAKPMTLADGSLFTINTRYTYSSENGVSAGWIAYHFLQQEMDDVYQQEFLMPNGSPTVNVIGVKLGKILPNEIVVVGAHFDSTSERPSQKAPGAIDNGSGTVSVMLLAAALRNLDLRRTVHLVAFGGEEQGLYGSSHYVDEAKKQGLNIVSVLTMDMTAYSNNYFGVTIEGTTNSAIQALMRVVSDNTAEYAPALSIRTSTNSFGSDHVPFQRAGYAAILCIERDDTNYPHYHRSTDTTDYANEDQAVGILKGIAGALYDEAGGVAFV